MRNRQLTNKDVEYIKEHFPTTIARPIAEKIGCSPMTVYRIATKFGLKKQINPKHADFIKQNWQRISDPSIAKRLKLTAGQVRCLRYKLGLIKTVGGGRH